MGEAAGQVTPDPQDRMRDLQSAIGSKRRQLTDELNELKRRRIEAMHTAREAGKMAAVVAVGAACAASLINAVIDLMRPAQAEQQNKVRQPAKPNPLTETLSQVALSGVRMAALQLIRFELERLRQRLEEKLSPPQPQ